MKQIDGHWLRNFGKESLQHIANTFSESAVFIVDHTQTILYWSEGAEQLLGFTASEIEGQHCLKGIRCQTCMKGCGIKQFPTIRNVLLTLHTKEGDTVTVQKNAHSFYDSDGRFAGGIEILIPVNPKAKPSRFMGFQFHDMRTQSNAMRQLFQKIRSVAKTDVPVLARGESGTGKELLAKALHLESKRSNHPFVTVNCSAISENLIESELFGHAKGAFTGAHKARKGLFEQAHKGSLFLDEIVELPLSVQAKLLRVLETQTFKRVGDNQEIHVDVRIITATHTSLRKAVLDGRFRSDLMYRLRVVPLFIPPLRERPEDIEFLLQHFLDLGNGTHEHQINRIDYAAKEALLNHPWPGNVREIRNVVDFAFALGCSNTLSMEYLPPEFSENNRHQNIPTTQNIPTIPQESIRPKVSKGFDPTQLFSDQERILQALQHCNHHLGETATLLGISRVTLWRKRKKYNL